MPSVEMEVIGFEAPVQVEGSVDGILFFFRARYDRWQFGADTEARPGYDEVDVILDEGQRGGFYLSEHYDPDNTGYSAGHMDLAVARRIVMDCVQKLIAWNASRSPSTS